MGVWSSGKLALVRDTYSEVNSNVLEGLYRSNLGSSFRRSTESALVDSIHVAGRKLRRWGR